MKSLEEKLNETFYLANRLFDLHESDKVLIHLSEEDVDELASWADGLPQKRIYRIMSGQCSLQTTIDFDIAKEEERIDDVLEHINKLLENEKWKR